MIQQETDLEVADNTGAHNISVIQVYKKGNKKMAFIGDIVNAVVKKADPEGMVKMSTDWFFCKKAREAGIEIWTEPTILVQHIGNVNIGPEIRRGLADFDGQGDAVTGTVVMRYGENALTVINRVKEKLKEVEPSLPKGVKIVPVYDRSELILKAIDTLKHQLIEEMIIEILDKQPIPVSQQGKSTIFRRCTPAQGDLIKAESLQGVFDLIRMLDAEGYPHAFVDLGPFRLEFTRASRKTDHVLADVRITMIKKVD